MDGRTAEESAQLLMVLADPERRRIGHRIVDSIQQARRGSASYIGVRNLVGAAQVADDFIKASRNRITLIYGPLTSSSTRERLKGFSERFLGAGSRSARWCVCTPRR